MQIKNKKICEVLIAGLKVEHGTNARHSPYSSGTLFCVGLRKQDNIKKSITDSRIPKLMD